MKPNPCFPLICVEYFNQWKKKTGGYTTHMKEVLLNKVGNFMNRQYSRLCFWITIVDQAIPDRAPRWGFTGCGIRPILVVGFGIGSKIVAGYGIQISAGCGIGHKIIAGFGIQISRGNGMRSENCSGNARWSIFTLKGNRSSRIDSKNIKILLHLT